MVAPLPPNRPLSVEEYLELENASPERHEYLAGGVFAMTGASKPHNRITLNIATRLHTSSRGGPCTVFALDLKLRAAEDAIYYPDVMVVCGNPDLDALVAREPCFIVEVTSPSTVRIERGEKLQVYQRIASLRTYLIVEQAWRRVERHWRDATGEWQREELVGEGTIPVPCPETTLTLDEIYEGLAPLTVRELEAIGYAVSEPR